MTWRWPHGPATAAQYALIRRLAVRAGRPVPPALTEVGANRYIRELIDLIWGERQRA